MHSAAFTQTKISSYKVGRLSPPIWLDGIAPWAAAGIWGEPYPRASRHRESSSIAFGLRLGRVRFVAGGHPQNTQAPFAFADAANAAAFFRTNSCTLSGPCRVSVRTSSDIRS